MQCGAVQPGPAATTAGMRCRDLRSAAPAGCAEACIPPRLSPNASRRPSTSSIHRRAPSPSASPSLSASSGACPPPSHPPTPPPLSAPRPLPRTRHPTPVTKHPNIPLPLPHLLPLLLAHALPPPRCDGWQLGLDRLSLKAHESDYAKELRAWLSRWGTLPSRTRHSAGVLTRQEVASMVPAALLGL